MIHNSKLMAITHSEHAKNVLLLRWMWNIVCSKIYFSVASPLSGGIHNSVPPSSIVVRKVQCKWVELPLCLSTILETSGGTEVLTFTHYVLVSDNAPVAVFWEKNPKYTLDKWQNHLMAVWAAELYSNSPHNQPTLLSYPCIVIISNVYIHYSPNAAIYWWILCYEDIIHFFHIVFSAGSFNPGVSQNSSFLPLHKHILQKWQSRVFVWSEKSCSMYVWTTCTRYTHASKCCVWCQHRQISGTWLG